MSENGLTIKNEDLVSVVGEGGISDVIKPLIGEIHLFDTFVAGTSYIKDKSIFEGLKIGDKLNLQREDNKFDSNAIVIMNEAKQKVGYIPEKDNAVFARLMDAGKMLMAKISNIDAKGSFLQITIGIYLVDF